MDAGFDCKELQTFITSEGWSFVGSLKKTRGVYTETQNSQSVESLFQSTRKIGPWQTIRMNSGNQRKEFRIRTLTGELKGVSSSVRLVCSEKNRRRQKVSFMKYRQDNRHPVKHYIPIIEDHDSGNPIAQSFHSQLIYAASEFFSWNPTVVFQGSEQSGYQRNSGRANVDDFNEHGDIVQMRKLLVSRLAPYRIGNSFFRFHHSQHNSIVSERVIEGQKSLFFSSNKGDTPITVTINLQDFPADKAELRHITVNGNAKVTWQKEQGKALIELDPKSLLIFEIAHQKQQ